MTSAVALVACLSLLSGAPGHAVAKKTTTTKRTAKAVATTAAPRTTVATVPVTTSSPGGKRGGEAVFAISLETLSGWYPPTSSWGFPAYFPAMAVFDTLLRIDRDGRPVPNLLASMPTPNSDSTKWTLTLRPGITFHNGEALDGAALALNMEALRTGVGASAFGDIEGCAVSGPLSATCTMRRPWTTFGDTLFGQASVMTAPAQLKSKDAKHPIGTGPFMCVGDCWKPNESMKLVRNPNYWRVGLPKLDSIEFRPVVDEDQRVAQLQTGQVQFAMTMGYLTMRDFQKLAADKKAIVGTDFTGSPTDFMFANLAKADNPLRDVRLRRAVASAIDVETLRNLRAPGAKLATGVFSPAVPGYLADSGYPKFDVAKAKALVEDYKAEKKVDKVEIVIGANTNPDFQGDLAVLKQMIERSGIDVRIGPALEASAFTAANTTGRLPYDLARGGTWPFWTPDQYWAWVGGLGCGGSETACLNSAGRFGTNFSRGTNAIIDSSFEQIRGNSDPVVRKRAAESINRELSNQVYWNYLWLGMMTVAGCATCGGLGTSTSPDGVPLAWAGGRLFADTAWLTVG